MHSLQFEQKNLLHAHWIFKCHAKIPVWGQTQIYQNFLLYLSSVQYLLRDTAYTPTSYMVSLYKALEANQVENTKFNKQLLHICISIKHTFGIPKKR